MREVGASSLAKCADAGVGPELSIEAVAQAPSARSVVTAAIVSLMTAEVRTCQRTWLLVRSDSSRRTWSYLRIPRPLCQRRTKGFPRGPLQGHLARVRRCSRGRLAWLPF